MVIRFFASVAVIGALGLLVSMRAYAFGLGNIEAISALNQPFKAEIPVTALRDEEAGNLEVRLASHAEFERAGIERSFLLTKLKFDVVETAGSATIVITSEEPIKEPFVELLLTATTGNGRLLREYTVLLDPPKTIFPKSSSEPQTTPPTSEGSRQKSNVIPYQDDSEKTTRDVSSYGSTNSSDTLWNIASKTKQDDSISVQQQMIAIINANPRAFNHENVNGLKAGYNLSIPSVERVREISKTQAISVFNEQNTAWKNRNATSVAVSSPKDVMSTDSMSENNSEKGVIHPTTDVLKPAVENDVTARLKLVAPEDKTSLEGNELTPTGSNQISKLSEQLTLAKETIEGQAQENIDIKARMDIMEEQIQTLRQIISLKDNDLARLQSSLEQERQIEAETSLNESPEENSVLSDPQQAEPDVSVQDQNKLNEVEQYFKSVEQEKSVVEQTDSMEVEPQEKDIPLVDVKEEEEPVDNMISGIDLSAIPSVDEVVAYSSNLLNMDKDETDLLITKIKTFIAEYKLEIMSGMLLFLLLLWLFVRRSSHSEVTWDEAVEKLDNDEAAITSPEYEKQQDEEQLEETLVEEIVEDNVVDETALTDDIIEEIEQEPVEQVLETAESDENLTIEEEIADLAFSIDGLDSPPEESTSTDDIAGSDDDSISFDSNLATKEEPEGAALDAENDLESEIFLDEPLAIDIIGEEGDEPELEFDIDPDAEANLEEALLEFDGLEKKSEGETKETDEIELEFGDFDKVDEVDEAETKLDLAAAYIDMGDPDGAKSILDEVNDEGNDEQKQRAQSMLKNLS